MSLKVYSVVISGIFIWWLVTSIYSGVSIPPSEGDSLTIHIPAAERIINRTIFQLDYTKDLFYPSAVELILALFILLKIPLGLFNIIGVLALFIGSLLLGKELFRDINYSLVFAVSASLLHGIIRWSLTQKPDIFMLASLAFLLWIVLKQKRKIIDYLLLGLFCAFFIGAKFNGPVFLIVVLLPFYNLFIKEFSWKKLSVFIIPFTIVGLSWYLRNIYITGDPVYFPDYTNIISQGSISNYTIYAYLTQPLQMANGYLSEFMLWSLGIFLIPFFLYKNRKNINDKINSTILKSSVSAFVILIISLAFPYRALYHQMVGTMRYTLPMIFLIMICIFLIFKKYGHERLLAITVIPMIIVSQMQDYHPKIILLAIPLIWIIYFRKYLLPKIWYDK